MRKITLGTTYYQNPQNLKEFLAHHYSAADELIIVDDGSVIDPITDQNISDPDSKIKIFMVTKDLGFNSHGCRNLIMKESTNDWVVLLDCDRIISDAEYAFDSMRKRKLNPSSRYIFVGHVLSEGKNIHYSVNDYLIHRNHFFSAGGYDEELVGYRNGDRCFFKQLLNFGTEKILSDVNVILTRSPSLLLHDQNSRSIKDKSRIDSSIWDLVKSREKEPDLKKPILTFEWKQINLSN